MGLFEHWPYVNFHDLNLDWVIKEIPKVFASRDAAQASAEASAESAAASQLSADAALASQEAAHQSELNAAQSEANAADSAQDAFDTVEDTLNQITVLQSRVDNIIPSGTQTEGNTELLDIRVGAYGEIYDSAGNAVRDQIKKYTGTTRNIQNKPVGRYQSNASTGVISNNPANQNIFGLSDKIICEPGQKYSIRFYTVNDTIGTVYLVYYANDGTYLSSATGAPTSVDRCVIETPEQAYYLHVYMYRNTGIAIDADSNIQIEKGYYISEYIPNITAIDEQARQGEIFDVAYTEKRGYFSPTGSIVEQSETQNEYYTDLIDISVFKTLGVQLAYNEQRSMWIAYATYDANGDFIERPTLISTASDAYGTVLEFSNNVKYVAFTYRKYSDGVFNILGTASAGGVVNNILSKKEEDNEISIPFPLQFKPCYDHLFVNSAMPNITIPHESLYHVRLSRLFGFNVIEANVAATSDGVYIVNHLNAGKFGQYFHHVDGTTDISNIELSSVTWNWVSENVRYNTVIPKYQTRPCRLEEFLSECRQQNIIPFVYSGDVNVLNMASEYMGMDNYIAYGASRENCPTGIIYHWVTRTTKEDILEYCQNIGKPFIYGMANPTAFTDSELKDIIDTLHENGFWIGVSYADDNWYKYSAMGIDVNGTQSLINRIDSGNVCNYDTVFDYSNFTYTNATENDGKLTFSSDGVIYPNVSDDSISVGIIDLEVVFDGTVTLVLNGVKGGSTVTSDGSEPVFFATPILNNKLRAEIRASSGTVISDIKFKASLC